MKEQSFKTYEALRWASSFLSEHGMNEPIPEILLRHFLQVERTKFFMMLQEELPQEIKDKFEQAVIDVSSGIPVQHITGYEFFYGRKFIVNENVLIPRPETEELIEGLLNKINLHFPNKKDLSVVDVGTGSGAIAITLALEEKELNVTTIDISPSALEVAKENAARLQANINFLEGDLLNPILTKGMKVDVIVSNPPYISEEDFAHLDTNVRDHEPTLALVGGVTGYELYERLIMQAPKVLNNDGILAFEVGVGQSKRVAELIIEQFPEAVTESIHDINGKDRIVFALINK